MTLNVTVVNPAGYIIQSSDRRMVSMPSGNWVNDSANKGLVLQTDDGIFSVTFAGVGISSGQRVDLWLAETMLDAGIPEIPILEGLPMLAGQATAWFKTFPDTVDKRHTFVIAGWLLQPRPQPKVWIITNCAGVGKRMPATARAEFDVQELPIRRSATMVYWFGLVGAIDRNDKRPFFAALQRATDFDQVEEVIVSLIRRAAAKRRWSWGIGQDVLSIGLSSGGEARSTYYPVSAPRSNYAPLFVWYDAGRNITVGDAEITPASGRVYRFARAMLVDAPGAERELSSVPMDPSQIRFRMRISEPKFKKEARGDSPIVEAFRVKEVKQS